MKEHMKDLILVNGMNGGVLALVLLDIDPTVRILCGIATFTYTVVLTVQVLKNWNKKK